MNRKSSIPGYDAEAEFYDYAWESFKLDTEFYRRRLRRKDRVLDCMCGTGRVAIALARDGHQVVGIDVSPRMLRRAREKARKEKPEVRRRLHWRLANLTGTDLGKDHDAAIIALDSYGLILSRRGRIAALMRIRHALRERGRIFLALDSVQSYREVRDGIPFPAGGGPVGRSGDIYVRVMAETGSHSPSVRSTALHLLIDRKGRLKRSRLSQTVTAVLSPTMVEEELRRAGFRLTRLFGGYDGRLYSPTGRVFILEAAARYSGKGPS